jgi:hypothetical protein
MPRLLALSLIALCVAVAGATPATAATKTCKKTDTKTIIATNVKCKRAKKVLRRYVHGKQHPFGYTCKQEQYEGGATTRCTKGNKIVEMQVAD